MGEPFVWDEKCFLQTLDSVMSQSVPMWQLQICVTAQLARKIQALLSDNAFAQKSKNISVVVRSERGPLKRLAGALEGITTEWVAVINGYDVLAPTATYLLLKAALEGPTPNVIYGDHGFVSGTTKLPLVHAKPAFSEDLLCSQQYIGDFFAVRAEAIKAIGGVTAEFSSAWAHDLLLRLTQATNAVSQPIMHVPEILHYRRRAKPSVALRREWNEHTVRAVRRHFARQRRRVQTSVFRSDVLRNKWPIPSAQPKVSLIIPTRDGYKILKACVESILQGTSYTNYEILIVDNQSIERQTLRYLRQLSKRYPHIRVLPYDHAFNYSAINNYAVAQCSGSIVGFINNDVEVLNNDWLTELVSHALRPEVGVVGALLLYPDHTVQHGGVVVGMHGVADHAFKGARLNDKRVDPFGMLQSVHNPDAVTAAAMVMRKELFQAVGGFDMQHFVVAFNDVDLCLKLRQRGQRIVFTPHARLIHHESKSRNLDQSSASKQRERYEHAIMKARWGTDRVPKANPLLSAYA